MRLLLISAWNDSGGGFLARLLDGHSGIRSWPFELQLGVAGYNDDPDMKDKYRWPVFAGLSSADVIFDAIIDGELKPVLAGTAPSRFAGYRPALDVANWRARFAATLGPAPMPAQIIAAYVSSYFVAARIPLGGAIAAGHCPCIVVDWRAIFHDFPDACLIHVARDPGAGLGDFRRRHPGFSARDYARRWIWVNRAALDAQASRSDGVIIARYEQIRDDRATQMARLLRFAKLVSEPIVFEPTWQGKPLQAGVMGPFGGIGAIGRDHDKAMRDSVPAADLALLDSLTDDLMAQLDAAAQDTTQSVSV